MLAMGSFYGVAPSAFSTVSFGKNAPSLAGTEVVLKEQALVPPKIPRNASRGSGSRKIEILAQQGDGADTLGALTILKSPFVTSAALINHLTEKLPFLKGHEPRVGEKGVVQVPWGKYSPDALYRTMTGKQPGNATFRGEDLKEGITFSYAA